MIGTGRSGTVWLAVHLGLEEYRAIKCISRRIADYETVRREALILKKLRHPAIPIVYDLEEDQEYLYLVEEYLQGSSLYTLIRNQGVIQEAEAVRYGIQLCQLVQFLHSAGETPILHLDLHPNNLIICKGIVKIIDFGQAVYEGCEEGGERRAVFGFASPEQYLSHQSLDTRADLYAIGAVLSFMVRGIPNVSPQLGQIIGRCMEPDREKRFRTADQVERRLKALPCMVDAAPSPPAKPSLVIAVVGSRPGVGATHLSLGLCADLSARGADALYVEKNQSGHMRCLAEYAGSRPDRRGIFRIGTCRIKPWYGESAALEPARPDIVICDYGSQWELLRGAQYQALLMIAGASPWEAWDLERMLERLLPAAREREKNAFLVFRAQKKGEALSLRIAGEGRKLRSFCQPFFRDPLEPAGEAKEFYEELWRALSPLAQREYSKKGRNGKRRSGWPLDLAKKGFRRAAQALTGRDAG